MTSAPAIGFDYRPSHVAGRLLAVVTVLAQLAIVLSGIPAWTRWVLAPVVLAGATLAVRQASRSPVAGVALAGERWTLYRHDRSEWPATLASFRIIGTCVLLRLRGADRMQVLLLAPDNADPDLRRRLRMRLAALACAGDPGPL